jgi:hypothetical protein
MVKLQRLGGDTPKVLRAAGEVGKQSANDSSVRSAGNEILRTGLGTHNNAVTVEKIAAASKARRPGGKARAFGKLAGDATGMCAWGFQGVCTHNCKAAR